MNERPPKPDDGDGPIEVEQKYRLDDSESFVQSLLTLGAVAMGTERNEDHYFNHPVKDFAQTREALRIRLVDGRASITYKGPKLPGSIKARRELEWSLGDEDVRGEKMRLLLTALDFRPVAVVTKVRRVFQYDLDGDGITVVVDRVDQLGDYAEVEMICGSTQEVDAARQKITKLATRLGLNQPEMQSYLSLRLDRSQAGR